ncbi:TVP38/TMEM64 family inner membrane protein ydjZ [Aedoeadaptatus ivorii]|uniref:TVP38/TMEM64 family membrane protein n=1 Tax=Aedoeadaptatus ivorii TaxID=54006 RepID=A0A3S4YUZ2_9FIRM|nr:TVP38/TMEM64 family protein [Peptoniphilus ivorii]MDQ0509042.1 putative membrane protein YdjX (TVP38/TMEM64 family) [Peptoniphilus ivorii]VEJ35131.1 TVP38/TMEM64 family inner membrane protein ydjZ [Peptoniphilus ivorii]
MIKNWIRNPHVKKSINIASWVATGLFLLWMWRAGLLTDENKIRAALEASGAFAPLVFIAIQAIQVVIPILPGAVGCVFGVVFFGSLKGFLYNYIGICLGSIAAFYLSRRYGSAFARQMAGGKTFEKYLHYLDDTSRFEKVLAFLIFFPFAPDDILCYVAGLSRIRFERFTTIILLGKPFAIWSYTMGMVYLINVATKVAGKIIL